ncbi:MAG TPA: SprB repeat-containing protein, partial [Prolixibacteraceae bacterium]|nr:SprB repeat-containing protein [Prolixibacteraceae bacterium]
TVTVTEPAESLSAGANVVASPSCAGCADGQALATATGGWGSYAYLWDNGETDALATALTTGTWTVTITDLGGCTTQAEVTIDARPDITITLTASPNIFKGETLFNVVVRISELNGIETSGPISVVLPKDGRWSLEGNYDPVLTLLGSEALQNADWSYVADDPDYHIFSTSAAITSHASSTFGFRARFDAGKTKGVYTITGQIISGGGNENRVNNNADSEKLNYFAY